MAETILITITDVQTYRKVDPKIDNDKFEAFANEVQRKNLRNLLGSSLYYDMFNKYPDGGVYDSLVDGKVYTYSGETIQYYGLKPLLSMWWLAIATRESDSYLSGYGAIQFTNNVQQNFETSREKERISAGYMETAQAYANDVIKFLTQNSSDYPLWKGAAQQNQTEFVSFKL